MSSEHALAVRAVDLMQRRHKEVSLRGGKKGAKVAKVRVGLSELMVAMAASYLSGGRGPVVDPLGVFGELPGVFANKGGVGAVWPFASGSVGAVVTFPAVWFASERAYQNWYRAAWAEAWRVLAPGGMLVLAVAEPVADGKVTAPFAAWHTQEIEEAGFRRGGWVERGGLDQGTRGEYVFQFFKREVKK